MLAFLIPKEEAKDLIQECRNKFRFWLSIFISVLSALILCMACILRYHEGFSLRHLTKILNAEFAMEQRILGACGIFLALTFAS